MARRSAVSGPNGLLRNTRHLYWENVTTHPSVLLACVVPVCESRRVHRRLFDLSVRGSTGAF